MNVSSRSRGAVSLEVEAQETNNVIVKNVSNNKKSFFIILNTIPELIRESPYKKGLPFDSPFYLTIRVYRINKD